jgi:solute carrier family 27 fatty acid transporter 1/4
MGFGVGLGFGIRSTDRLYITMPLYHSAAGILGTGQTLLRGIANFQLSLTVKIIER